ncbi:MAG TPA: hypothetical protein PLG90_02380 [Ignavibacteria bacterium]|nr:hypothetical protein [Ignavibacteria bacterium]
MILFKLINNFSVKEFIEFEKFILSPFYNSSERIIKLFYFLKKFYPSISDENLVLNKIYEKVFPDKKFDDSNYRKLISDFNKIIEKFLVQKQLEKNSYIKNILLSESLKESGDKEVFNKLSAKMLNDLNEKFNKDSAFYYTRLQLENDIYYTNFDSYKPGIPKILIQKSQDIDLLFSFLKLNSFSEVLTIDKAIGRDSDFDFSFFDSISVFISKNLKDIKKNHPNLYVIYLRVMLYKDKSPDSVIKELINYLKSKVSKFSKEQLNFYYSYASSFYWEKYSAGNLEVMKDIYNIYDKMIKSDSLILYKKVFESDFHSLVLTGLYLGKYTWLENIIYKYGSYLDKDIRKDVINLSLARLYFRKKDFEKAISLASKVKNLNAKYYVNVNFIIAKSFFELGDFNSIEYILDNLNHYKKRNKQVNKDLSDSINVFVYYMSRLIKYYSSKDKNSVDEIKIMLKKETRFIPDKKWLLEKIN